MLSDVFNLVRVDGRDVVFLLEDDGSAVSTEQRLYLHRQMTKLNIPAGVLYLPEIVADGVRVTLRSLICIRDIANPLCSEGLVCVSNQFAHVFYVLDAGNDRIVREVPDREGFWGQPTYGFGHSCRGFKIIRKEDPHQPEPMPDHHPTILHIYHRSTDSWTEGMSDLAVCDPFREPAVRSPLYGLSFWKVNAAEAVQILAYDLEDDSLYDIAGRCSFVDIPDEADGDDLLSSITFGLGSGGEIIGARFTRRPVEGGQVIDLHFDFQLTPPQDITMPPEPSFGSDITLLTPLIGLGRDDHLQSLFFLVLEDKIICIDFHYNGISWGPLTKFILDGPTPKFTAICLGPITISPESHSSPASGSLSLEESKEATKDQSSENTGPSRSRGSKKPSRYGKDKSSKNIRPSSTMVCFAESGDSNNAKSDSHDNFNVPNQVSRQPFRSKAQADYEGNPLERNRTEKLCLYGEVERTKDCRVGSPLRQGVSQKGQVPGASVHNSDDLSLKKAYIGVEDVTDGAKKLSRYGKDKSSKNIRPSSTMESDDSSNSKSNSHDSFNVPSQVSRLPFSLKAQADYEGNHLERTCAKKLTKGGKENRTIERDKPWGLEAMVEFHKPSGV
ncbi:uncharacterized protein LOC126804024 isoform X3 [Argentina anserina]|uniref:uncharacterized protein LOC126804024 isoform X3 n=1 Tax=Argentina anserina TaxID=57926 RepID=UPI0021765301|nr:uncharacterized protein LOC126804024 isoform X3 [Potentilla anserina]